MSHIFGPLQKYAEKLNLKFVINPDLPITREAQYNASTDTITLRSSDLNDNIVRSLTHELIHAVQDQLGLTDNQSHANVEYQTYLLVDIIYTIKALPSNGTVGEDAATTYGQWLANLTNDNGSFNKDEFNEHWKEYFKPFMDRYKDEPTYQSLNDNYDWKWNKIIDILFTDIKDEVGGVIIFPAGEPGG